MLNDIILKISRGDTKAFRKFYDIYSGKVFRFAKQFIKSNELCEEIVSDVFINIWQVHEKLADINNLESYLFILTRNKALNYLDKKLRIPIEGDTDLADQKDLLNPEGQLIVKELETILYSSIDSLPERCRLIFLLSREEKLKYGEISKLLSISERTVQTQIGIALKKLNESLKKYLISILLLLYYI